MEREKRKLKLQQFIKGEKGLKKGSLRINSGSQELSTFVMHIRWFPYSIAMQRTVHYSMRASQLRIAELTEENTKSDFYFSFLEWLKISLSIVNENKSSYLSSFSMFEFSGNS